MVEKGRVRKRIRNFWQQVIWGVLTYPFVSVLIYLLVKIANNILKKSGSSDYLTVKSYIDYLVVLFEAHPYQAILGSLFIGILISSVTKLQKKSRLINSFGINFFSNHSTPVQIKNDWEVFIRLIQQSNTQHLYILGATGRDTFQDKSSPLYKFVNSFQGDLKIMLLDPQTEMVNKRAHAVGESVPDYRKQITGSISYLKELYKAKNVMEVKTYSDLPNLKMIMTERYLWLQYYNPGTHIDNTPVFGIYKNNSKFPSLYELFFFEFHKLWSNSDRIDLN